MTKPSLLDALCIRLRRLADRLSPVAFELRDHEARVRVAEKAAQTRNAINLNAMREHRFAMVNAHDFPKVSA